MPHVMQETELCCAMRQELGVRDILAVDLAQPMLDALAQQFPPPGTLGNEPGVKLLLGFFCDACVSPAGWS